MSAITGIFYRNDREVDSNELHRMTSSLAHRGRDDFGVWWSGPVGLGHRMLWTTPESLHEHLPLVSDDGQYVITADARIDNRDELLDAFGLTADSARIPDSALILQAYELWKEGCVDHLVGDFAFAIWDDAKHSLFCARDHMGVKPFYYYQSDKLFAFSSEIKALFCLPEVPREINELRVGYYLMNILDERTLTFYEGILRLPAAFVLVVSQDSEESHQYWSLDPSLEISYQSDAEYAAAFREIFTEAVRCRLRSAFPVGSDLSGGLDSSSVVCVARDLLAQHDKLPLPTFSNLHDTISAVDDRVYMSTVVAQGGISPHYTSVAALNPLDTAVKRVVWDDDDAMYAPNSYLVEAGLGKAQQAGIRIKLTGFDGDTVVSHGGGRLTELARRGHWWTLIRNIRGYSKLYETVTLRRVFFSRVAVPLVPSPIRKIWRFVQRRSRTPSAIDPAINAAFAHRIGLAKHLNARRKKEEQPSKTLREEHHRRLNSGLGQYIFEVDDRLAAAFALEVRHPFYDKRLVEFCLALPSEQKLRDGWTRIVLRCAMENLLPREVQWRTTKSDPSPSFHRNLMVHGRSQIEAFLKNPPAEVERYVDISVLRQVFERYTFRPTEGDALILYRAVTLASWLDQNTRHSRSNAIKTPPQDQVRRPTR